MYASKLIRSLLIATTVAVPLVTLPAAQAEPVAIGISIGIAPPPLPVYVQPYCPGDGYIWTPGYWSYAEDGGYYWVPGVWVIAPQPGYLWTPAYWGWEGGFYHFHEGYWGPHVGFYGGINYGFGYGGYGFEGGEWRGGHFFYNTAVVRFGGGFHTTNVFVRNVTVINHTTVSYNGGHGGVEYHARPEEMQAVHENHIQPTGEQMSHEHFAAANPDQHFNANHGHPTVTAAATPAAFHANPHDPVAAARPTVNGREGNQQQRIANGVKSGQMTSGEAARADQRQANIDRQVHNDRTANGGTLTPQERTQVNHEQNNASRQIYNENHNTNTARPQPQQQPARPQPQQQQAPRPQPQQQQAQRPQPQQAARPAPQAAPAARPAPREEEKKH